MAVCSKANKVISAVILAHFTPRPRFPLASGYVSPATGLTVCNKHPPFSLRLAWLSLTNWPGSSGNNQPLFSLSLALFLWHNLDWLSEPLDTIHNNNPA